MQPNERDLSVQADQAIVAEKGYVFEIGMTVSQQQTRFRRIPVQAIVVKLSRLLEGRRLLNHSIYAIYNHTLLKRCQTLRCVQSHKPGRDVCSFSRDHWQWAEWLVNACYLATPDHHMYSIMQPSGSTERGCIKTTRQGFGVVVRLRHWRCITASSGLQTGNPFL